MAVKKGNKLANTLIGTSAADQLFGFAGNDVLKGKAGNDRLDGGKGADRMAGGLGNDTYIVDRATDKVIELADQGNDTVMSGATFTIGGNVEHLILTGSAAINGALSSSIGEIGNSLTGNSGANTLNGGQGHDLLSGGLGSDVLIGGDGNDTLIPGAGNGVADIVNGGPGFDTIDYRDALGGVHVNLGAHTAGLGASGDVITDVENVVGSAFADTLYASSAAFSFAHGGAGNDVIVGNQSALYERLRGDDGVDTLVGTSGEEDFVLQLDRGMDLVQSFRANGNDHVLLDHEEFGLELTGGTRSLVDGVEFFSGNFSFGFPSSSTARLFFDTYSNILWADKDGSGSAHSQIPIALFTHGSVAPTAGDIWLM